MLRLVTSMLRFMSHMLRLVAMFGFASSGTAHYIPFTHRARDISWFRRRDDDFRATFNNFGFWRRRGRAAFDDICFLDCRL